MSIKDKIVALIAKAQSTDNEHEAEVFLAKANELLEKYQLSVADLEDEEDRVIHFQGRHWSKKSHNWFWDLYRAVAVYYGCDTVRDTFYSTKKRGQIRYRVAVIGRKSAVATTEVMYPYLFAEVNRQARIIAKRTGMTPAGQANRVGAALVERIWRMIPAKEEARTEAARKHALVTTDQVEALVQHLYPGVEEVAQGRRSTDALSREAAANINLAKQTGSGASRALGKGTP